MKSRGNARPLSSPNSCEALLETAAAREELPRRAISPREGTTVKLDGETLLLELTEALRPFLPGLSARGCSGTRSAP